MITQNIVREKSHYENLYERDGDHSFIGSGYPLIHELTVSRLEPGDRILDVGCGSGQHSRRFAQAGLDVTGVELSENAVETGRRVFEELELDAEFICGDVRKLPRPDRHFDASFLSLILHHFLDFEPVLREAARVSGRYVFVFEPNAYNPQSFLLLNVVNPVFSPAFLTPNQRAVSPRRVASILESCGFRLKSTDYLTLASTAEGGGLRRLIHGSQRILPAALRHNKFVQVYERID